MRLPTLTSTHHMPLLDTVKVGKFVMASFDDELRYYGVRGPLLWSRDNIVVSHTAGPGQFSWLRYFLGFFLSHMTNVRKTQAPTIPRHHWPS